MDPVFRLEIDAEALEPLPEKEALVAFRRAAQSDPTDPDYHYLLGSALTQLGRHEEALKAFRAATHAYAAEPTYHTGLGMVLWRLQRYEAAADAFQEAVQRAPEDVSALNSVGVSAMSLGKVRDALPAFEKALSIDPDCAAAHANLGLTLWRLGRQNEAEKELREAVRLRPEHVLFQRNLGRALLALERATEALECFEQTLAADPNDAEAQMDAGDALFALGRNEEADAAYGRGLMADPKLAASRASSSEARLAILLERVRAEVKTEPTPGRRVTDSVLAGLDVATDMLRRLGGLPRSRGLAKGLALIVAAIVVHAAWVVVPAYFRHYSFKDDVAQIGRASVRDDREVLERLMHAVREHGLQARIREESFHIETSSKWRKIECSYEVPLQIVPGLEHRMRFRLGVEEPFLVGPDPVFF